MASPRGIFRMWIFLSCLAVQPVLVAQADWEDAELVAAYDSLVTAAGATPATGDRARLLHEAGNLASRASDFAVAIARTQEALKLRLGNEKKDPDGVLVSATNLGIYHNRLTNYREALKYFGMVLSRSPNRKEAAVLYQSGLLYEKLGEFAAAEQALIRAGELPNGPGGGSFRAYRNQALATLYLEQRRPELANKAIPLLKKALAYFKENEMIDAALQVTTLIGWARIEAGDIPGAIRTLIGGQARAAEIDAYPEDWSALHANLGLAYRRGGNAEAAINEYRKAIVLEEHLRREGVSDVSGAIPYDNLSTAFLETGRGDSALYYANFALSLASDDFTPTTPEDVPTLASLRERRPSLLIYLRDKAKAHALLAGAANYRAALNTYRRADELLDEMRRDQLLDETRAFWRADARGLYAEALAICSKLNDAEAALYFMEKARARLLIDEMSADRALAELPKPVRDRLRGAAIEARSQRGDPAALQQFRRLQDSVYTRYPDFSRASIASPPPLATELPKLLDGATLLSYFLGNGVTYVLHLAPGQALRLHELAPPSEWKGSLGRYLNQLKNPAETVDADLGLQLTEALFAGFTFSAGEPLLILPDDLLHQLPFGALLTEPPGANTSYHGWPWLAGEHVIRYGFSLQHLRFSQSRVGSGNGRALAMAPVARVSPGGAIGEALELPATLATVQQLAGLFPTDSFINQSATPENFWRLADDYSLIHLGTHGRDENGGEFLLYDPDQPFYTAEALLGHQFNADLVVIGACETGRGAELVGEGVASLGRGFIRRGAGGVVMSLWSVDDGATADLLSGSYTLIAGGAGPAAALSGAGDSYRRGTINASLGHPYYWAGLVAYGLDRPLRLSGGATKLPWLVGGGLVALCILALLYARSRAK